MKSRKLYIIIIFICFLTLSGCFHRSSVPPLAVKELAQKSILLKHVNVFTGDPSEDMRMGVDVLIDGNRIAKIGNPQLSNEKCTVIDGKGKTIIPGLIDHHIHITSPGSPPWYPVIPDDNMVRRNLSAYLFAGITTVFDMGGPLEDLERLKTRIETEESVNPRFFYAGKVLTKNGGHPDRMIQELVPWPINSMVMDQVAFHIDNHADVAHAISENQSHGSCLTKIMVDQIPMGVPSLYEDQITDIVGQSGRRGLLVGAHIGSEADLLTGLYSGGRLFCHAPYRSAVSDVTIAAMKESQTTVITTLVVFENSANFFENTLQFTAMDRQIEDPQILDAYENVPEDGLTTDDPQLKSWIHDLEIYRDIKYENICKMKQAGITLIAGTDSPNIATVPGSSLHTEMRLLVEKCGFTPKEALAAATSVSGDLLERTTGEKGLGRIAEGGPADLVILNKDFTDDITQTENIYMVISNGRIVNRKPNNL